MAGVKSRCRRRCGAAATPFLVKPPSKGQLPRVDRSSLVRPWPRTGRVHYARWLKRVATAMGLIIYAALRNMIINGALRTVPSLTTRVNIDFEVVDYAARVNEPHTLLLQGHEKAEQNQVERKGPIPKRAVHTVHTATMALQTRNTMKCPRV